MKNLKKLYENYGRYNIFYNQLNLPSPSVEYAWRKTKVILHKETLRLVREQLRTKPSIKICDIGCGNGAFLIRLAQDLSADKAEIAESRVQFVGLDLSQSFVDYATGAAKTKNIKNTSFIMYDVEREKLPNSFDIIISSEVIEHLKNPDDFIHLIYTHLLPNGYFLLSTPNSKNLIKYPLFFLKQFVKKKNESELRKSLTTKEESLKLAEKEQHIKTFSHQELRHLLENTGFEVYETPRSTTFFGGPFLDNHTTLMGTIMVFDALIDLFPIPNLGWNCIVFSQKKNQ